MKNELEFKGFEPASDIRSLIDRRIAHLERKAQRLSGKPLFLRCAIEEVAIHKLFRVSLALDVPQKMLVSRQEAHDVEGAIQGAFDEIERQLETYKSALRGEHQWKRVERRELKLWKAGASPSPVEDSQ